MRAASSTELPLLSLARMRLGACLGRTVCRHPIDMLGLLVLAGAGLLILGNALYMQAGAHPSPMRSPVSQVRAVPQLAVVARPDQTGSFAPLPKPAVEPSATQTIAADRNRGQLLTEIQRQLGRRGFYEGAVDGIYGPRMDAAIRDFEQAAGLRAGGEPSEHLLRAIMKSNVTAKERATEALAARREQGNAAPKVIAIQRALSDHGYGQIKANGVLDGETRAAIEKFERERKLPVTGQVTHRLSRELAAVTGRPLE
jgi:peptidoglycan hydrolase-like protein with peptidoglycan-binding domain